MKHTSWPLAALVVLAACGSLAVVAGVAAAEEDTAIHGCVHARHGLVRIVADETACKGTEKPLSWNKTGPAGPKGDPGPAGPPGPKGDPGTASLAALVGTPCKTFDGADGKVSIDVGPTDLVVFSCDAGAPPPPPPASTKLVINEIDYDQVGTDTAGFVELFNGGTAAATLDGLALVFVNGGDNAEYHREALTGSLAAGAYLTVDFDAQNGAPDGAALVDTAAGSLVDALSYEGAITAAVIDGTTYNLVEGTALPATVADSNTVDGSLSRIPNGSDTNDANADWSFTSTKTPGAANALTP